MNKSRALLIAFFLVVFFLVLVGKLADIQISKHEYYSAKAFRQQIDTLHVKAERGLILDRFGETLVYTKDQFSFYADTRMLNDRKKDTLASVFSRTFGKDKEYFKKILASGNGNVCLWKKADRDKLLQLENITIDGLFYEADYSRIYPYAGLAAHVLGYVNRDLEGIAGIENEYDKFLTGTDGFKRIERDVIGRPVSVDDEQSLEPVAGQNVHLTINKTYQQILEEELYFGLEKSKGKSAVGIIMNPKNGEILAISNFPTYDPKNYSVFDDIDRKNISITDMYEPGSTMKSVTMAAILNEGLAKESEVINTENGVYKIKGAKITDDHKYEKLNVREILEHSSNIGMTKLADRLDSRKFYKYLRDFGFGMPTYVDLPGEVPGMLKTPDNYSGTSKSFMSFGYEIAVTPLQMVTAYSTLINGGLLYKPFIVNKITNEFNNTISEIKPVLIRKVIKPQISQQIKEFMVGVVEQGTGQEAGIERVNAGGKTGTSQRWTDEGYSKKEYNASFIGFLPADDPKIVCLIVVYSPQNGKYGGTVAAPIFKRAMQRIVESDIDILPNNVIKEEGEYKIFERFSFSSSGKNVQEYANPQKQNKPLYEKEKVTSRSTMPNLRGYSVRDAVSVISELGLKSEVQGRGRVIYQSIPAGTMIQKGKTCEIKCRFDRKSKQSESK